MTTITPGHLALAWVLLLTGCLPQLPMGGADDTGAQCPAFTDLDGDGYGAAEAGQVSCEAPPSGVALQAGDCDDDNPDISPAAAERCDGVDQDCDGAVDEEASDASPLYADADGDGYGLGDPVATGCGQESGLSLEPGDCDDESATIHPDAEEICSDGVDNDCAWTADCALTGTQTTTLAASHLTSSELGAATATGLAMVGDANDDLYDDLLVGAPFRDDGANDSGTAWLVYGEDPLEPSLAMSRQPRAAGERRDNLGTSVVGLGDQNGDGYVELAAGAPYSDRVAEDCGAVSIFYGRGAPVSKDRLLSDDLDTALLLGGGSGHRLGQSLGAAGDLNGDGLSDLLLASPGADAGGEVWLLYGDTEPLPPEATIDAVSLSVFHGDGALSWQLGGQTGLGASDLDGDGRGDLAIGAPAFGDTLDGQGALLLLYGDADTWSGSFDLDDADAMLLGSAEQAGLGLALASGRDLNGDGWEDLAVSGLGADGAGQVQVLLGSASRSTGRLASGDAQIVGAAGSLTGSALAFTDLDGDGLADLAVGAPGWGGNGEGAAGVFYGGAWSSGSFSLESDAALLVSGERSNAALGGSLGGGGDLNGDGVEDLALGAPGESGDAGAVWLLLGQGQ